MDSNKEELYSNYQEYLKSLIRFFEYSFNRLCPEGDNYIGNNLIGTRFLIKELQKFCNDNVTCKYKIYRDKEYGSCVLLYLKIYFQTKQVYQSADFKISCSIGRNGKALTEHYTILKHITTEINDTLKIMQELNPDDEKLTNVNTYSSLINDINSLHIIKMYVEDGGEFFRDTCNLISEKLTNKESIVIDKDNKLLTFIIGDREYKLSENKVGDSWFDSLVDFVKQMSDIHKIEVNNLLKMLKKEFL